MKNKNSRLSSSLMNAYRGIFRELYAFCFAITGSEQNAADALTDIMLQIGEPPLRKKLFARAKALCLKYEPNTESRYSFLEDVPDTGDLSSESDETRRALLLVCGCGLSLKKAARATGLKPARIEEAQRRALACMPGKGQKAEKSLEKLCISELRSFTYLPDMTSFGHALEKRLENEAEKSGIASGGKRLLSSLMALMMLLLIGFMLWVAAILLNYFRDTTQNTHQNPTAISEETNASIQGTN